MANYFWRSILRDINNAKTSSCFDGSKVLINDNSHFKALPMSVQERINGKIERETRARMENYCGKAMDSLKDVQERSSRLIPMMMTNWRSDKPITQSVKDSIMNFGSMAGVYGQDPATMSFSTPNIFISAYEAATIYSQKGIPETILNKKGKSPFLNGVKIKNDKLTPEQCDKVKDNMIKHNFVNMLVDSLMQSLIYGGALVFPMFKKDTPLSLQMNIEQLLKYDVVGKNCIDRFVVLDRWNTVFTPQWNPTAEDFLHPKHYFIPFLGSHVNGQRASRIITGKQYGYYANLMTFGWGISDIPGWIESVYNYCNVMNTLPNMINQMSILVRSMNVDGILATEGSNILDDIDLNNTVKVRQASVNNPIDLDIIGDLHAIQRDFKEVPNLVRLMRQHVGANANIPEELLWSTEKGAFSSGDNTEGAQEKQWESVKYIHKDVGNQIRNLAMLLIIDALGKDRDVLSALPYTTVEFDNPVVSNAEVRAKIATNLGKTALDMTASGIPVDAVMQIVNSYGDEEFAVRSNLMDDLKKRQKLLDKHSEEKHEKEMELLEAQIEQIKAQIDNTEKSTDIMGQTPAGGFGGGNNGGGSQGVKGKQLLSSSGGSGYSKLQQKQHERSRGTNNKREGIESRIEKQRGAKVNE